MTFRQLMQIIEGEIGAEEGARLAEAICRHASGERIYIPERPGPPEIFPGDTARTVAARYRVHRATAYRWVNTFSR